MQLLVLPVIVAVLLFETQLENSSSLTTLLLPARWPTQGYPFEVALPRGLAVAGVVLADHLKSVDWETRRAEFAAEAPAAVTSEVAAMLASLLGVE